MGRQVQAGVGQQVLTAFVGCESYRLKRERLDVWLPEDGNEGDKQKRARRVR